MNVKHSGIRKVLTKLCVMQSNTILAVICVGEMHVVKYYLAKTTSQGTKISIKYY